MSTPRISSRRVAVDLAGLGIDVEDGPGFRVVHEQGVLGGIEDAAVALLGTPAGLVYVAPLELHGGTDGEDLEDRFGQRAVAQGLAIDHRHQSAGLCHWESYRGMAE